MGTRGVWSLGNVESKYPLEDWVNYKDPWLPQYDIGHSRPYPAPNLQRWNFGTSTMSNSTLACSRYWGQASGNTTVSYFASGDESPGMTKKTNTDKLSYSPYTIAATPTANLTNGIDRGGASSSNLAAYFSTGYPTGSWVDKILFATDTKSTLSDDFGSNNMTFASLADGAGGGYLFESNVSGSKTYKITYSTDGLAHLPGSNLVDYTTETNGEMMTRTAGYKSGGALSTPAKATSVTNKLTYSSTTWSAVPAGGLPIKKRRAASGTGRSKGFVGGGDLNVAPVYSDFALLDFSTDTYAQEPALNFSPSSYGYYPNKSTTTPLDGLYGADKATDMNSFWSGDEKRRWYDNGPYAVEFDGSTDGDALAVADFPSFRTNNFTVECWIYPHTVTGGINTILDMLIDGGSATNAWWALHQNGDGFYWGRNNANPISTSGNLSVNTWYHVAMVRNGTSNNLYLNGASIGNFTESAYDYTDSNGYETRQLNIGRQWYDGSGRQFDGLITNVRITIGQALYTANFTPTTESLTTTSQGATASNVKLLCCNGSTPTSSTVTTGLISRIKDPTVVFQSEVGGNSETISPTASTTILGPAGETGYAVDFDGSDDALNIPHNDAWYPETNYTAECWFNCTGHSGGWDGIFGQWNNSNVHATNSWILEYVNSDHELRFYYIVDGASEISYKSLGTVSTGAWHHFAFSKAGSTTRLFIDGVQVVADFDIGTLQDGTGEFTIGGDVASGGWFDGKISNVRITKGQALYTAPFTVTTEPLTTTSQGATASNVKLLCCNQSTATGSTVTPDTISAVSSPTASQSAPLTEPRGVVRLEGYVAKGRHPAESNDGRTDVYKFSYSTETWSSSVSGTMPVGRKFPGATSNTTSGYWAGGTPGTNSQVDKFVWSTNTGSTIPAQLGSARGYMTSAAGNQTQGYFAFGNPSPQACDKLVYSSETMSNLPSMPFPSSRAMGVSMQTHGYYGSGAPGGSRFAKITFANDSKVEHNGLRAHPSGSNMFRTAASSNTKVYVCSGESSTTSTESIPWSTDSVSNLPTSFMPAQVTGIAGQGDNTNAYFTGGPSYSHTQRIVYASDTVSVLPGANFPAGNINAYGAGGPGMNGIGESTPNVI